MNLIAFAFLISMAIHIVPKMKLLPFTVGLLPMSLQQGMSFSYDSIIISSSIFLIASFINLYINKNNDLFKSKKFDNLSQEKI